MGFGDQAYAGRFRDLVTRIARSVVSEMRPEPRLGKVYSFNPESQTAQVLFAGDTIENLVSVRVSKLLYPNRTMVESFDAFGYEAPGDILRVWGRPGSYFAFDFYGGQPKVHPDDTPGWVLMPHAGTSGTVRYICRGGRVTVEGNVAYSLTNDGLGTLVGAGNFGLGHMPTLEAWGTGYGNTGTTLVRVLVTTSGMIQVLNKTGANVTSISFRLDFVPK